MIGRDIRRANVIIWSIANETVPSKSRNAFLKRLANKARSLDSTRLISMAMEVTYLEDGTYTIKDELNAEVDIISFNEYFGWYVQPKDIPNAVWRISFDKPVIISEFGGGALAGRRGGVRERWTEEMQKDIYEKNVKMFNGIKNLSGTCPWILNDFRSPRRPLTGVQDGYNRKGLLSIPLPKKVDIFYTLNIGRSWRDSIAAKSASGISSIAATSECGFPIGSSCSIGTKYTERLVMRVPMFLRFCESASPNRYFRL